MSEFTEEVRPKSVGEYMSPYELKDIPLSDLMDTLIESNKILRGSKKIASAVSMARIVNMDMNFVSSNGSNFKQSFMYVGPGFRVIAQDGKIIQSRSYTDQCQQAGMENFNKDAKGHNPLCGDKFKFTIVVENDCNAVGPRNDDFGSRANAQDCGAWKNSC